MATTDTLHLSVKFGAIPTSTVVVPSTQPTEFERFENLTEKLVRVPKRELDSKRKA